MSKIPEQFRWQGVLPSVPKHCSMCDKRYTKTIDDQQNEVWFCSNSVCPRQGFGFMQQRNGVIVDGLFKEHLQFLQRHTNVR